MKNFLPLTLIISLIIGAIAFWGGMEYQKTKNSPFSLRQGERGFLGGDFRNGSFLRGNSNGQRFGGRGILGEIIDSDEKSLTVKLADGSSKIILLNSKTMINKASEATLKDFKKGEKVMVFGSENSDGSFSAQNIQLNPLERVTKKTN